MSAVNNARTPVIPTWEGAEIVLSNEPGRHCVIRFDAAIVARATVAGMAWLDLYDYLANYGMEPHGDNLTVAELRIEVLLDIQVTGPALFCQRMIPASCLNGLFVEAD